MSRNMPRPREVTECVLHIHDGWAGRIAEVVAILVTEGVDITRYADDGRDVAGVVESSRVHQLLRLPCVQGLVEGARYAVGGKAVRAMRHVPACHGSASLLDPPAQSAFLEEMGQDDNDDMQAWSDLQSRGRAQPAACPCAAQTRGLPVAARLGYGVVALLAMGLLVHAGRQACTSPGKEPVVQVCGNAALVCIAIFAGAGLWRHRLVRHACTALALLMSALSCVLWVDGSLWQALVAFGAFLIGGTTSELLSSQQ